MSNATYYIPINEWQPVEALPKKLCREDIGEAGLFGQDGWQFFKRLDLVNTASVTRKDEPVEVEVEFHAGQVTDPAREIRVAELESEHGPIKETPSQIYNDVAEDEGRRCRIVFIANLNPAEKKTFLIFYGNPKCPHPNYETDLKVSGEEYALDIENKYYRVALAKTMGHLKSVSFKEGKAAFGAGGPPMMGGHGVEGTVHWNPDWSDEYTGRYRVTNWEKPPNYSVIRGPICVRVKRWGHPILALGPSVGQPEKVMATVTYTFYSSVPYILMESRFDILEDVFFSDCRNDEWLGMGSGGMPDIAWMMKEGEICYSTYSQGQGWHGEDPAWMTYFNRETGDGFATIRAGYECTHPHWSKPASVSIGGNLWVRYPLHNAIMRKGDYISEKNAYLIHKYEPPEENGFGMLMNYYKRLLNPVVQQDVPIIKKPLTVSNVLDALRVCYDEEVYLRGKLAWDQRRLSVVDLGLIYDVKIADGNVHIAMTMPYKGRETWFLWFTKMIDEQIKGRIDGVKEVEVECVWEPAWSPDKMTQKAKRRLGFNLGE